MKVAAWTDPSPCGEILRLFSDDLGMTGMPMPERFNKIDEWHWMLKPAVQLCGAEEVWTIGMRTLGFPVSWAHAGTEFEAVNEAVQQEMVEKWSKSTVAK